MSVGVCVLRDGHLVMILVANGKAHKNCSDSAVLRMYITSHGSFALLEDNRSRFGVDGACAFQCKVARQGPSVGVQPL